MARRVLAQNPQLFQKQLTADKESAHEVVAYSFHDEEEEASWLLEDIVTDGHGWGDYAFLYR
jgi:superfamily I DNA/RNA helicase